MPERADLERRTTELLQSLIRFDTVNPPGNEQAAQEFLKELLESKGFECQLLSAVEGRPNLVARLRGASDGPRLCLLGHVDTVLADPDAWTVDPWSGELRDDCVWGRGALDMKSQVAAEIAAAAALADEGWRPEAGELLIVVTADEEAGATYGAQWLCAEQPDAVRCDIVVNEGAGEVIPFDGRRVYGVCVAEKGVFRFTLATHGRAGHASIPRIGDNALTKMAPLLEALSHPHTEFDVTPEPEALISALGLDPSDPAAALRQVEERDPRVAILLEPMLGVTLSPTMIEASQKINVIPSRAELHVDCRVPPELGEDEARKRIEEAVGPASGEAPGSAGCARRSPGYELRFDEHVVGNRSPIDTPLMDHIRAFVEREDPGAEVAPVVLPGFSDSHWWRKAFPDCVAYGFFPQNAMDIFDATPLIHGADERVPVADLGLSAAFYAGLMQDMLK